MNGKTELNDGPANSDQRISVPRCQVDWHNSEMILVSGSFVRRQEQRQSDRGFNAFVSPAVAALALAGYRAAV